MEVALLLAFLTTLGICLIFLFDRQSSPSERPLWTRRHNTHHPPVNPYQAVSVATGKEPCGAARALGNTRFLADEAPDIPVPGCDQIECHCRYLHYDDRRSNGSDRRQLPDRRARPRGGLDRRQQRGRRRSDWSPLAA